MSRLWGISHGSLAAHGSGLRPARVCGRQAMAAALHTQRLPAIRWSTPCLAMSTAPWDIGRALYMPCSPKPVARRPIHCGARSLSGYGHDDHDDHEDHDDGHGGHGHSHGAPRGAIDPEDIVNIVYIDKDGTRVDVAGAVGDNALYLAHRNGINLEGACEASLACSTCHVILTDTIYDKLCDVQHPEEAEVRALPPPSPIAFPRTAIPIANFIAPPYKPVDAWLLAYVLCDKRLPACHSCRCF